MNLNSIGQIVQRRRQALGLSQARLAKLSGLSRATINQLETGTLVDLGASKLIVLLDLLGIGTAAADGKKRRQNNNGSSVGAVGNQSHHLINV